MFRSFLCIDQKLPFLSIWKHSAGGGAAASACSLHRSGIAVRIYQRSMPIHQLKHKVMGRVVLLIDQEKTRGYKCYMTVRSESIRRIRGISAMISYARRLRPARCCQQFHDMSQYILYSFNLPGKRRCCMFENLVRSILRFRGSGSLHET